MSKTETIGIKVTEKEKELVKKLAEEANTSVSRFLHKIVFDALAKGKEQQNDNKIQ